MAQGSSRYGGGSPAPGSSSSEIVSLGSQQQQPQQQKHPKPPSQQHPIRMLGEGSKLIPPPPPPRSTSPQPPEPSAPSGTILALTRCLNLEAQMAYAFAKHMLLMGTQKILRAEIETLENMAVSIEAFQDELDKLTAHNKETQQIYGD